MIIGGELPPHRPTQRPASTTAAKAKATAWRPDPETLRWAAGQVRASGPHTPDTSELLCAYDYVGRAAQRLKDHADRLDQGPLS